ncbi:hypothetical protein C8R45DRAFT_529598 [Mycena sanguinolenta]|nr:hypothetical protein C8R45DRAFT_529598 [Mycena sanguinolenta]
MFIGVNTSRPNSRLLDSLLPRSNAWHSVSFDSRTSDAVLDWLEPVRGKLDGLRKLEGQRNLCTFPGIFMTATNLCQLILPSIDPRSTGHRSQFVGNKSPSIKANVLLHSTSTFSEQFQFFSAVLYVSKSPTILLLRQTPSAYSLDFDVFVWTGSTSSFTSSLRTCEAHGSYHGSSLSFSKPLARFNGWSCGGVHSLPSSQSPYAISRA